MRGFILLCHLRTFKECCLHTGESQCLPAVNKTDIIMFIVPGFILKHLCHLEANYEEEEIISWIYESTALSLHLRIFLETCNDTSRFKNKYFISYVSGIDQYISDFIGFIVRPKSLSLKGTVNKKVSEEFCLLWHNSMQSGETRRIWGGTYRLHLQG
jgi:hypothetical protein